MLGTGTADRGAHWRRIDAPRPAGRPPGAALVVTVVHVTVGEGEYFELTIEELREVARFAASGATEVLGIFEDAVPADHRPRAAIAAAWEFANGAGRTNLQRVAAMDSHRAAKDVGEGSAKHAAHAAGDAAASAYLHPFAKADQVGHILRADAHAAYAQELRADDTSVGLAHLDRAVERASPMLIEVLRRYPPAAAGRSRVSILMKTLDDELRAR